MAPKETIQKGRSSSQAPFNTLPNASAMSPSSHLLTLSDAQEFIDLVKGVLAMQIAPTQTSSPPITVEHLEQLLLKLIETRSPDSTGVSEAAKPDALGGAQPEAVAQASRLEFKIVNEVYVSYTIQA
jgi:hypothetical protein